MFHRIGRIALAVTVGVAASGLLVASPAHAAKSTKVIPTLCFTIGGSGDRVYLPEAESTVDTNVPLEVNAGEKFNVTINVETRPAALPVDVVADNIVIEFKVTGGAKPSSFKGTVAHDTAPQGSVFHFGPFKQTLTAPAKPGPISIKIGSVFIDRVFLGENEIPDVQCDGPDGFDLTLANTEAVAPPPPGAPDAKADAATTDDATAVTVDVLANDVPASIGPIDESSLKIVSQGAKGSAVLTDGKVVYTPNGATTGVDIVRYRICTDESKVVTTTTTTVVQQDNVAKVLAAAQSRCDEANVNIEITEGPEPQTTPPTTVAAAAELPRTGSTSGPAALAAMGAIATGLALLTLARRRAASA